jgi:hypothetical protein
MADIFPIINQDVPENLSPDNYRFNDGSSYLFNRSYEFAIGAPGTIGKVYRNLRIIFEVEKSLFSSSNKAKIQVYNFNDHSRENYVKGVPISLKAGYAKDVIDFIFVGGTKGRASRVSHERKGADVITTFECGDGEATLTNAVLDRSFPPGTPVSLIVDRLLEALGISEVSRLAEVEKILTTRVYTNGYAINGSVKKSLDKVLLAVGLTWSIQNGEVQILVKGKDAGHQAIKVDRTTGLIGVPSSGSGGDNIVKFTSLLNPRLIPGSLVFLNSILVKGIFVVKTAKFEGDSHGPKWQVTCECAPVKAQLASAVALGAGVTA